MCLFYTGKPRTANRNTINTIPQEPGEYQIWDSDGNLQHVGITNNLRKCAEEYRQKNCFNRDNRFDYLVLKHGVSYYDFQCYEEQHIDQHGVPAGITIKELGNTHVLFSDDYYPDEYYPDEHLESNENIHSTENYSKTTYAWNLEEETRPFDRKYEEESAFYEQNQGENRRPFDKIKRKIRIIKKIVMIILWILFLYYLFQLLCELGIINCSSFVH